MKPGRLLQPGDIALTDYNATHSALVSVRIVERDDLGLHGHSQSGILYRVDPPLRHGTSDTWYDADWFGPA